MTYRGRVKGGIVVLDSPKGLADGTEVEVSPLPQTAEPTGDQPTLAEVLKDVIGKVEGFPSDSSINHDHYLYGTSKK